MTVDMAIELLIRWQDGSDITSFDDFNVAINLGIEALKEIKRLRSYKVLLPGESCITVQTATVIK